MTYGSGHYWASEDLNTTGENVGITLDSMCDIIAANDVTNGNAVVFVPGDIEHGEKGHFALGEGSGGGTEIDADLYQVLTGDGEGNGIGAQGGSSATEANKIYLKDKRLGPNIPTCEDDGTPIQDVNTGSFTIASNALGHTHTETIYDEEQEQDVEVQVEDDGWKATIEDLAKVLVTGKSKIEIGELGADYSANAKFWNEHPAGPDIKIKGAAKIEMLGKADPSESDSYAWGVPVVSMRGNCLIDMCDSFGSVYTAQPYQNNAQNIRRAIFNEITDYYDPSKGTGIFAARNFVKQNAPILQMKGRATISIQDESVIRMTESSCLQMEGNAYFKVNGGGYTGHDNYSLKENTVFQHAEFNAGSIFLLDGDGPGYGSTGDELYTVMAITNQQMAFSNGGYNGTVSANPITTTSYSVSNTQAYDVLSSVTSFWSNGSTSNNPSYLLGSTFGPTHDHSIDGFAVPNKKIIGYRVTPQTFMADTTRYANGSKTNLKDNRQYVLLEGSTRVKLGATESSDSTRSSLTSVDIGGLDGNSYVGVAIKASRSGSTIIDIGTKNYADYLDNVHVDSSGHIMKQLTCKEGQTGSFYRSVEGPTTINCNFAGGGQNSPSGVKTLGSPLCGITFSAARTDIEMKWTQNQVIWDGYKHFLQIDGNTHVENWSGKVVIRSTQDDIFNPTTGACYPYFTTPSMTPESQHETRTYQFNNPNYPTAPDTSTLTPQDIEDKFYSQSYNKPKYTGATPWDMECIYSHVDNVVVGEEATSYYYYIQAVVSNYKVKDGTITFTFKDSTEYTTLADLSNAIAANPEKLSKQWYDEEIIGLSAGTISSTTQTADGWEYTITSATTVRRIKSTSPWEITYYSNKTMFDTYATSNGYWPISAGMTLNQMPNGLRNLITSSSNSRSLAKHIGYFNKSIRGVTMSDLIYSDVVVDEAYVQQPYSVEYDINFAASPIDTVDWYLPSVQQSDLQESMNFGWNKSPIVQLRDCANISIHGKFNTQIRTYSFTTSETYDISNQQQAIEDFIAGSDYNGLLTEIEGIILEPYKTTGWDAKFYKTYEMELWKILSISAGSEAGHYSISYTVKPKGWQEYIESTTDCPVVEITDDSEIRLYDGAIVKGYRPDFGETTFEFKSSDSSEEPVSFTLSDLKALKQLLNNL